MPVSQFADASAYVLPKVGVTPTNSGAAATSGTGFDRTGYGSCAVHAMVGAASGTPDSFTAIFVLEHSDASGSGYAAFSTLTTITAAGELVKNVDLAGAKKYIRVTCTVAFVNGTSPKLPVACSIACGGAKTIPVA
jgi:hypothetical protein